MRAGRKLGEKVQDALVDSLDKPLIYGNADQGGDKALGHRSDQVCIVLTKSAVIPLKNEIASSYNQKSVDAAKASFDFPFKVRQQTLRASPQIRGLPRANPVWANSSRSK